MLLLQKYSKLLCTSDDTADSWQLLEQTIFFHVRYSCMSVGSLNKSDIYSYFLCTLNY